MVVHSILTLKQRLRFRLRFVMHVHLLRTRSHSRPHNEVAFDVDAITTNWPRSIRGYNVRKKKPPWFIYLRPCFVCVLQDACGVASFTPVKYCGFVLEVGVEVYFTSFVPSLLIEFKRFYPMQFSGIIRHDD